MGAIRAYMGDQVGNLFTQAALSGATMPMILHSSGNLDEMVATVEASQIKPEEIDARVRQVLERKAELGLLRREVRNGVTVYINNIQHYLQ